MNSGRGMTSSTLRQQLRSPLAKEMLEKHFGDSKVGNRGNLGRSTDSVDHGSHPNTVGRIALLPVFCLSHRQLLDSWEGAIETDMMPAPSTRKAVECALHVIFTHDA